MTKEKNKWDILAIVKSKNLILRLAVFFVAVFIGAFCFNMFLVPNNIVIGGISGLSIVVQDLFGISINLFLNISLVVLFFASLFFLDIKTTLLTLLGSFTWNAMVVLSAPVAEYLNITFESTFIMLLFVAALQGICFGLVYRTGYNTGGADIILLIMNKYLKISMGTASTWFNILVILLGTIAFGPTKTVFAIFILMLNNKITDYITLGVKDSKMCFVKSDKLEKIEKELISRQIGVTEIQSKGGVFSKKEALLLVILSADDYYGFKHLIKKYDQNAFIMTHDCYTVTGGYKKQIIPF